MGSQRFLSRRLSGSFDSLLAARLITRGSGTREGFRGTKIQRSGLTFTAGLFGVPHCLDRSLGIVAHITCSRLGVSCLRHQAPDRDVLLSMDLSEIVPAFHRGGDDLVESCLHAIELQFARGGKVFGTLHQWTLLGLSYRSQSAAGGCRNRSVSGEISRSGSRRRARMLLMTSTEWTPSRSASVERCAVPQRIGTASQNRLAVPGIEHRMGVRLKTPSLPRRE